MKEEVNEKVNVPRKRYWLRGGLISSGIIIIIFILGQIFGYLFGNTAINLISLPALMIYILFCGWETSGGILGRCGNSDVMVIFALLLTFLVCLALSFIIGAIIGLIYGKIKNRKQKNAK